MSYSKKGTAKKQQGILSKKTMGKHRAMMIFARVLLICFFAVVIIGSCAGFGIYRGILASAPDINSIDVSPTGYLSTVYDADGNEIDTLVSAGSNRQYVTIDQIPKNLQHAFVAIEDERFYEHNGIDLKGIVRAGVGGILRGHLDQGASTITQQLLKNNVFTDWVNEQTTAQKVKRKLQEQYLAIQLEKKVQNKDWILENYLNSINLGQNTLGVQAASLRYFNKDVSELSLSECAVIAAITQNPSHLNPITNPEKNEKRMHKVLRNMLEQEYITEAEYNEALKDDVYSRIQQVNTSLAESNSSNSYFVDELIEQVVEDLITIKGYTETQAYKLVYSGGLSIYSTQDSKIQAICEKELGDTNNYPTEELYINWYIKYENPSGEIIALTEQDLLAYFKETKSKTYDLDYKNQENADKDIAEFKEHVLSNGGSFVEGSESVLYVPQPQASCTIIDQYTGEVKALVGGRGQKTGSATLNRASNTTRQPGSTFKVLAAYAPAIDTGNKTLASVQDDAPYNKTDGTPLRNADKKFRGFTSIREGITHSINVVAVKTLEDITPQVGYDYLLNFGFTTLSTKDIVQVLCLGGISKGVSNLELTAAYATIANAGTYTKPRFYTKIVDQEGNVLIDNAPQTHSVLKETTAWLLTSAMKDVLTKGTGVKANFSGMSIAGKSGTTTSNRDALFAGFTPYYTCVMWGGYDDNSKMDSTGYVKSLWRSVMSQIHADLPNKDFTKPSGIVSASICAESGLLPVEGVCSNDPRGSRIRTEYFAKGTVPKDYCDHHILVNVCSLSGKAASEHCPLDLIVPKVFIIGGSKGTLESDYLLPENFESILCTIHTGHTQELIVDETDDSNNTTEETVEP